MSGDDRSHELSAEEQRTVALFERCSQSVVHINTFAQGHVQWDRFTFNLQEIPAGSGSGFLWDDRHIVTNFHVIKDATRAAVVLADGTGCEAELVGWEPDCDLAVLRIEGAKGRTLKPLERGTSGTLRVGQRVFAIGNPFGLDQTLTNGIVSGLGREMTGVTGRPIRGLVQTDAAINPGNSGGPLLDARGRLIGVNTMIASPSGAFAGVGFAIPVDTVVRIVQQLVKYGYTKHAYLGIHVLPEHAAQQVSRLLKREGARPVEGALVLGVEPGSPADAAGLRPMERSQDGLALGDEILEVDGRKIESAESLVGAIEEKNIGDTIVVKILRRLAGDTPGEVHSLKVRLGERPGRQARPAAALAGGGGRGGPGGAGDAEHGYVIRDGPRRSRL